MALFFVPRTAVSFHAHLRDTLGVKMKRTLLLGLVLLLGGCAGGKAVPDLARLYSNQTGNAQQPPLIVIHGVLGGRLVDPATQKEMWPGSLSRVVFDNYAHLKLDIDREALRPLPSYYEVSGITEEAAGIEFYARLLATLSDIGGYVPTIAGTPVEAGVKRYYVYAYDWRQDNILSVRGLNNLIEQIRRDYGDPQLQVDIVAHSMGGLITRYYVRYGTEDVLDNDDFSMWQSADKKVRRAILLGTPNLGSIAGLDLLLNGLKIGLRRVQPEVVATFPSAYQVLPHVLRDWVIDANGDAFRWYTDPQGEVHEVDVFDVRWWRDHELAIFDRRTRERIVSAAPTRQEGEEDFAVLERYFEKNLERGRRFSWSLTVKADHVTQRYVVFGGSCNLTPARVLQEDVEDETFIRFSPENVVARKLGVNYVQRMLEPGDGTVTKASLLARQILDPTVKRHRYSFFPLDYSIFLCEEHQRLTENQSFQDNLLDALLSVDN